MTTTAPEAMKMMNSSKATVSKIFITSRQKIMARIAITTMTASMCPIRGAPL